MRLPPGFAPCAFREMLQVMTSVNPMLGPTLWKHLDLSEDEALIRIHTLEQRKLVQFAIAQDGAPACFVAPDHVAWSAPEEDRTFAALLVNFWDTTGEYAEDGRIVSTQPNAASVLSIYTPEGELSVMSTVAQRLLDHHLLVRDDQGRLCGPSKAQVFAWTQEYGNCDFCSDPFPRHVETVPDFEMFPPVDVQRITQTTGLRVPSDSVGGWATCDVCHALVQENRRTDLLQRAITSLRGGKFTAAALKGLHQRFWTAMDTKVEAAGIGAALIDFIEDRISPEKVFVNPKLKAKTARIEAIRALTGLTQDEMASLQTGDVLYKDVARKLSAWRKRFGMDTVGEQKIGEMLNAFERPAVMPPHAPPHWQQALDRKVEAMTTLGKFDRALARGGGLIDNPSNRLLADMAEDLAALKMSDVYSFNADTMHTIMAAASSIPHEAPLNSIEVPMAQGGWFWFAEPYPVASAPISSDYTHALLWTWDTHFTEPAIRFSAYVINERGTLGESSRNMLTPSTKWYWPLSYSLHKMLALSDRLYDESYGPESAEAIGKGAAIGKEPTLKVIMELSTFFMQCCQWFRQTVPGTQKKITPKLTQDAGHIERHARKRYEKAYKVAPTVRVIALRRSDKALHEDPTETVDAEGKRKLKVRFVVSGHHRLQPCGPNRKDVKLIWIDSYPKGPEDAPFQPPKEKVFAVIR